MKTIVKYAIFEIPTKEAKTFINKKPVQVSETFDVFDNDLKELCENFNQSGFFDETISHYEVRSIQVKGKELTESEKRKISVIQKIINSLGFRLINKTRFEDFLRVSINFNEFKKDLTEAKRTGNLNEIQVIKSNNRLIYVLS